MASAEAPDPRLSFEEAMELAELPLSPEAAAARVARRLISRRPAWLPGSDIAEWRSWNGWASRTPGAFGGHVYCQAGAAADRVAREHANGKSRFGLHTIHGYFNEPGLTDRPFIYDVAPLSTGRSFMTYSVTVRQPKNKESSFSSGGEQGSLLPFPAIGAGKPPPVDSDLGPVCFSALVSFKLPEPHSMGLSLHEPPPQARFASILSSRRRAEDWPLAPRLDLTALNEMLGAAGAREAGTFPGVHRHKVDMEPHNAGRPLHERRELILYRLLRPMPAGDGPNTHALVHAYVGDRNGLLMAANQIGLAADRIRLVGTMSNTFVVHTNAEDAVMRCEPGEVQDRSGEWWIYEAAFPRVASGRVILEGKVWSPEGVHVATVYQDGALRARPGVDIAAKEKEKL